SHCFTSPCLSALRPPPPPPPLFPYTTLFRSAPILPVNPHHYAGIERSGSPGSGLLRLLLAGTGRRGHEHFDPFSAQGVHEGEQQDRKSTRLNSSHVSISYAVFCLKKKNNTNC